ncbi:MAG: protein phosphatase 2C domain-containing protein [Elainella sp.]
MSKFAVTLQCPNPDCLYPDNRIGQPVCARCQSQLTYRYLWAVQEQRREPSLAANEQKFYQFGERAANGETNRATNLADIEIGTLVDCRYLVLNRHVWLDTQPGLLTKVPSQISSQAAVYLKLHAHRLHLPQLYAIHQPDPDQPAILLLDNAPFQAAPTGGESQYEFQQQAGQLQPLLSQVWESAPAVRQLNWLGQMLQLWQPLQAQGVASSLLAIENLHVEGWRFRIRQLIGDPAAVLTPALAGLATGGATGRTVGTLPERSMEAGPQLTELGQLWSTWVETAQPTIRHLVRHLAEALAVPDADLVQISEQLNQFLLTQAAEQPLQVDTAGATSTGPQRCHNEDACYPAGEKPVRLPGVAIVCDGIGGHAGGEVASQLALRSLELQLRTWLAEVVTHQEPLSPAVIQQQLVRMVRVVNNLIAAQNDLQGRSQRQRMGTTLTLAVQLPKTHWSETTSGNSHELYLVHIGDSRAYWLTPAACQQLTVDDDVVNREVQAGRSLYSHCSRQDAAALTQALGTHEADQLQITVQRFVIDADGILLLCSDGLSDYGLVEQHWQEIMLPVLQDRISLETAVQDWIKLADRHNGHDNSSVVLMHCRVQGANRRLQFNPPLAAQPEPEADPDSELTESAKALLYDEEPAPRATVLPKRQAEPTKPLDKWVVAMGIASITFVLGALGVAVWRELAPGRFQSQSEQPAPDPAATESPASPVPAQPEAVQPGAVQPEAVQPEAAQPIDPTAAPPPEAEPPAPEASTPAESAIESAIPTAPDPAQPAGE